MSSRSSRNVSLTPQLEKFIDGRVASGHYQTASEVVREALRLMEQRERELDEAYKGLKKKLKRGAVQAKRGESMSGQKAYEDLMAVFSNNLR